MRSCWSSHLPACWYIIFMFINYLCSTSGLVLNDWSMTIVFIWSSYFFDYNIPLSTTYFFKCINGEDRIDGLPHYRRSGALGSREYFLLIWKHTYYLPAGGNFIVLCNLTDVIGRVEFNSVKWMFVDLTWTT